MKKAEENVEKTFKCKKIKNYVKVGDKNLSIYGKEL